MFKYYTVGFVAMSNDLFMSLLIDLTGMVVVIDLMERLLSL